MLEVSSQAELAAVVELQTGMTPADGEAVVVGVRGDKLGKGMKLENFTTMLLSDQRSLAHDLVTRLEHDSASAYAVVGYGPRATRIATIVDDRLREASTRPVISIKIGVDQGQAFIVTKGQAHDHQPLSGAQGVKNQYVQLTQKYGAYKQPSYSASPHGLRSLDRLPSQAVIDALDTLDTLGVGDRASARQMSRAAALLQDDVSRDIIILKALDHKAIADGLTELYRRSPAELQGDVGTVAVFTNMTAGRRYESAGMWNIVKNLPAPANDGMKERIGLVLERNLYLPEAANSLKLAEEPLMKRLSAADNQWRTKRTQSHAISIEQAQNFTIATPEPFSPR